MYKNLLKLLNERNIFYAVLAVNLVLLFTLKFYPCIDGPAHLYNSNLIYHLIKGDSDILNTFFIINKFPVPNWTGHFILSLFHFIIPGWLAEKGLLFFYFAALSLSFRFLIKQLNPDNAALSIFIFPFAYSFLFYNGFYNYCLSFIFLFCTLGYWLKTKKQTNFKKYIVIFILLTLTYFSNVLTYVYTGISLGLLIIAYSMPSNFKDHNKNLTVKKILKELSFLLVASLPSLLLFILFYKTITFFPSDQQISSDELVKWLNDARAFIVYNYTDEENITKQLLHIMIAIFSISTFLRFRNNSGRTLFSLVNKNDVLLVPVLIALTSFFVIPDGSSAGMMSDRYCLMIYMLCIIWIAALPFSKKISLIIVPLILIVHFNLLVKHYIAIKNLNKDALAINKSSDYIKPNSIVLPINMSDNWLESHFSNYLGADKPMVILENYEASVGWFPVKWNMEKLPQILLGGKSTISGVGWSSNTNSSNIKKIDYVYIYGNTDLINDGKWKELKEVLVSDFKQVYFSDDKKLELFEKNN